MLMFVRVVVADEKVMLRLDPERGNKSKDQGEGSKFLLKGDDHCCVVWKIWGRDWFVILGEWGQEVAPCFV